MKFSFPFAFFLLVSGGVSARQYRRQDHLDASGENLVLREETGISGIGHLDARSQRPPARGRAKAQTEYVVRVKPFKKGFTKKRLQKRTSYTYGWEGGLTPDAKCTNGSKTDGCRSTRLYLSTAWLLVDKGADINAENNCGSTALILALEKGYEAVARLLIDKGADINATNSTG
ncbi:unnamed protein product [Clonostachys rosea f. rosea IK726]|uniref:Uncharacterized protein n=2 Tax=Bionectria ochroleuca TaxID=29856 RepID=A0A0B7KJB9_BIOOC|nr:unnamed protein product [Clonostachys rosea f. rosea IK726]